MKLSESTPKYILLFSLLFVFLLLGFNSPSFVYSNTIKDLEDEINVKTEELKEQKSFLSTIEKKIKEISSSNYSLSQQMSMLNDEISKLQSEIQSRELEIADKLARIEEKQKLLDTKKRFLDEISGELYMKSRYSGEQLIFSFSTLDKMLQNLFVKKSAIVILREDIEKISGEYSNLLEIKEALEEEKKELDEQKKDLDDSYALILAEKKRVQKELNAQLAAKKSVSSRISSLTASLSTLQRELLYSRLGGTHVNPTSVPSGGDHWGSLDGFNHSAPAGSFAVFSIGAYTNREGLSQWGAKARAEAGQDYTKILGDYYPYASLATDSTNGISIRVLFCDPGYSCSRCINPRTETYDLETDYLYRLGEMPENFGTEALKAQAVAARTYALNATSYGRNTVRGDECGQVIAGPKMGAWKSAVDSTRGVVLKKNGAVFSSQYAALNGGWVKNGVNWDTTDKSGEGDWMRRTWDTLTETGRVGTYYWFYKTWYRKGYSVGSTVSSSSCNRMPWLSPEEMADLVNAASRLQDLGATDKYADSRIVPIHDSCHSQGSPYSHAEMRDVSSSKFTRVVFAVTVNGNGSTSKVIFKNEDGRTIEIEGAFFKLAYNLRAPGYLRIPQNNFLHINIHKK